MPPTAPKSALPVSNTNANRLLQILWAEYLDSDRVFRAVIELLNHRNNGLAAAARSLLASLCPNSPRNLIDEATRVGLTPRHRAKIIEVLGEIGRSLELMDAVTLVNHRRLQSKKAVEAVMSLFDELEVGPGVLEDNRGGSGGMLRGRQFYEFLKVRKPVKCQRYP